MGDDTLSQEGRIVSTMPRDGGRSNRWIWVSRVTLCSMRSKWLSTSAIRTRCRRWRSHGRPVLQASGRACAAGRRSGARRHRRTRRGGYGAAGRCFVRADCALQHDPEIHSLPRHLARACWIAFALSDDDAARAFGTECVATSREQGAFRVLPEGLDLVGVRELRVGSLDLAEDLFTEVIGIKRCSAGAVRAKLAG